MGNKVKYPDFGQRMNEAADENRDHIPSQHHGRLQWVADEMGKFGHKMVMETARKWFAGETMPRANTMKLLANVMRADQAWLVTGQKSSISQKELKSRNALATGAVNLIAGMIQMAGGTIAFPDSEKAVQKADLQAIIRGAMYSIHVAVGHRTEAGWHFSVPVEAVENFILGICPLGSFHYLLIDLDREKLEDEGRRKLGMIEVTLGEDFSGWRRIESFAYRI